MQLHARTVQIARTAGVITGVLPPGVVDHETAHRIVIDPLSLYVDLILLIIENAIALVIPEDVERPLQGLLYHATYGDRASSFHVHVPVAYDLDLWHDNVEPDDVTLLRIRRDLALVLALVPCLDVLHLQRPSVRSVREDRLEPLVGDEHGPIHGEYVRVSSSDPRDRFVTELSHFTRQVCMGAQLRRYVRR